MSEPGLRGTFPVGGSPYPARLLDRHHSLSILGLAVAAYGWDNTPGLLPIFERNRHGIDVGCLPPATLVTLPVKLAMMDAAQRHRELVRHPAPECARLRKPKMVSLARLTATQGARLTGDEAEMILVTTAARLHRGEVIGSIDAYSRSLGIAREHKSVSFW